MRPALTFLQAAEIILRRSDRPLSPQEIVDEMRKMQLIKTAGKTPERSMNARLSVDINLKRDKSLFKRANKGRYALRERGGEEYPSVPFQRHISQTESVLVFPSESLDLLGHFHGIRTDFNPYSTALLNPKTSFFMQRRKAEDNPAYKQIVSYIIVKSKDFILRFTRGKITNIGQYLHGEYSIGFGGHVEPRDPLFSFDDYGFTSSVVRELAEETGIDLLGREDSDLKMIGVLNDDSSKLGQCHFAFIQLLELPELKFRKREKSINELTRIHIPELADEFGGYEYWSKLCIQTFFSEQISLKCHVHPKPEFSLREHSDIVLVVGYNGSGKTLACSLLADDFGYTLVPCSRIMQQIIGCGPIEEIGRQKLQDLGYQFINGENAHERLARGIVEYIGSHRNTRFALDGLRYPQTLEVLQKLLDRRITVIYIESPIDNLFRSYQGRGKRKISFAEFLSIVNHPVERQIEQFRPIADITVFNHGSKKSYLNTLREFFAEQLE